MLIRITIYALAFVCLLQIGLCNAEKEVQVIKNVHYGNTKIFKIEFRNKALEKDLEDGKAEQDRKKQEKIWHPIINMDFVPTTISDIMEVIIIAVAFMAIVSFGCFYNTCSRGRRYGGSISGEYAVVSRD